MKLKKMLAGHLIVLGLFFPHAVSAEQFTFNVGIDLKNLHEDVDQVRVECQVQTSQTGTIIGSASKDGRPDNGNINNTTLQLKFDVFASASPGDAKFFRCSILLVSQNNAVTVLSANNPLCVSQTNDFRCTKAGTQFSGTAFAGPIP